MSTFNIRGAGRTTTPEALGGARSVLAQRGPVRTMFLRSHTARSHNEGIFEEVPDEWDARVDLIRCEVEARE